MLKLKTVSDVMPTRRDLLRYGGLGLAGAIIVVLFKHRSAVPCTLFKGTS